MHVRGGLRGALAIGYEDPEFPTNKLRIGRDPVEKHAVFLEH